MDSEDQADEKSESGKRHYAMMTLSYLDRELMEGRLIVNVNLPELNREIEEVIDVTHLIPLDSMQNLLSEAKEELTNRLFERLVIEQETEHQMHIVFDHTI